MSSLRRWLIAVACVQILAIGVFALGPDGSASSRSAPTGGFNGFLAVGDRVESISGVDTTARAVRQSPVNSEAPVVILAFNSRCAHCATVAPDWKRWLDGGASRRSALLVTTDSVQDAVGYMQRHGLQGAVLASEGDTTSRIRLLAARTPWLFVLDGRGEVMFEGHGVNIAIVDSVVADLASFAREGHL